MAEHAFPLCQLRRRRRQPGEHRSERSGTTRCSNAAVKSFGGQR
jgi:hypothetical protein